MYNNYNMANNQNHLNQRPWHSQQIQQQQNIRVDRNQNANPNARKAYETYTGGNQWRGSDASNDRYGNKQPNSAPRFQSNTNNGNQFAGQPIEQNGVAPTNSENKLPANQYDINKQVI